MAQQREPQQTIIAWLNDAYAMENHTIAHLEGHARDAKEDAAVRARLEQHVAESRRHADLVAAAIARLGGDTSALKAGVAKAIGGIAGVGSGLFGAKEHDTLLKEALVNAANEQFEIAAYTALRVAAQTAGDTETARMCETILADERAMAQWLEQQLPILTQESLAQNITAAARS